MAPSKKKLVVTSLRTLVLVGLVALASGCVGLVEDGPAGPRGARGSEPPPPVEQTVAPAPIARLTTRELRNSVHDLFGAEAAALVVDGSSVAPASLVPFSPVETVSLFQLAGTIAATIADDPAVLTCRPADASERDACTERIVREQALRVYRRPPTDAEVARLVTAAAADASFEGGVVLVLHAILASPSFVYRIERGAPITGGAEPGSYRPLTDFEIASRLSFALWRSTPDDVLLDAALAGELSTPEQVQAQARRMLESPRAREVVVDFHRWWLRLGDATDVFREPAEYPEFDETLASEWIAETESFVEHVVFDGEGTLTELFTATYSFPSARLAAMYGATPSESGEPTMLPAGERAGLLTQAALIATQAPDERVAPIYRGAYVYRQILCAPLPDPPADIPALPDADPTATLREQITDATREQPCVGCHAQFNHFGFALGRYDALGMLQEHDANGLPVDARVTLGAPADLTGLEVDGAVELGSAIAESTALRDCYVDRWFRYLTGRNVDRRADARSQAAVHEGFEGAGRDVRELLVQLVSSDAFRGIAAPDGM
ncbi:MAG: DUF1592 domain-containing protein [Myxococcota bacterium]|nr:DUF1592 domain-containing protein [Myxococcota bacterium]